MGYLSFDSIHSPSGNVEQPWVSTNDNFSPSIQSSGFPRIIEPDDQNSFADCMLSRRKGLAISDRTTVILSTGLHSVSASCAQCSNESPDACILENEANITRELRFAEEPQVS